MTKAETILNSIKAELNKAIAGGANLLMPSQVLSKMPASHICTIESVKLSSNPDDGDVYPSQKADRFIVTKQGLMRLGSCAGIEWNFPYCGRTDDYSDKGYIADNVHKMSSGFRLC